jgi:hypothetical protein
MMPADGQEVFLQDPAEEPLEWLVDVSKHARPSQQIY